MKDRWRMLKEAAIALKSGWPFLTTEQSDQHLQNEAGGRQTVNLKLLEQTRTHVQSANQRDQFKKLKKLLNATELLIQISTLSETTTSLWRTKFSIYPFVQNREDRVRASSCWPRTFSPPCSVLRTVELPRTAPALGLGLHLSHFGSH